jgi:2-amino-4-hydroxy-6-hydroxymethyldihydropteridine diphosphokinase
LLFDDMIMDLPGLVLPHPRMEMRKFVMVPLSEIAPDHIHPVSGLTMAEILDRCQDPSEITPV